jgi:hypothetical protein
VGQDGYEYSGDLHFGKPEYFFWKGWTRPANQGMRRKAICPSGKISSEAIRSTGARATVGASQ